MNKLNATLATIAILALTATTGCKSDYEKYADDACACKDAECLKGVSEKYKSIFGANTKLKDMDEKMKSLPDSDKKAFERGMGCMMKIAMDGAK